MKFTNIISSTVVMIVLTGCGTIGNKVLTDQQLARKAAFALNTEPENIIISNREPEISGSLYFVATTAGKKHRCAISTAMGIINSSAICPGSHVAGSASCNPLLSAAGYCK